MNPLPLVLAQWRQSRTALLAMILLVALGSSINVGVSLLERAVRESSTQAADRFDLIVGAAGSEAQLVLTTVYLQPAALKLMPNDTLARLQADAGVAMAAPVITGDSTGRNPLVGSTLEWASQHGQLPATQGRWFARSGEAVVGSAVSLTVGEHFTPLHGGVQENVLEEHAHTGSTITVVGRAAPTGTPWDKAVIVPYETMLAVHQKDGHVPGLPAIVVKPRSVVDAYRLRQLYRTGATTATFPAETLTSMYRTLGDVRALAYWIAIAGQLLLMASIFLGLYAMLSGQSALLMSLRAIGASRWFIWLDLWLIVMAVLLLGLACGTAMGILAAHAIASELSRHMGLALQPDLTWHEWVGNGVALSAGAVVATWMAWQIQRASLSTALRA